MLVCRPVKAVVSRISSALLATSIALYLVIRHALGGGDEPGAHIGEIAAEHLGRAQRMAVTDAAREHDRPVEERAHRADEGERIEPAGLAAGAAVSSTSPSAPAAIARSAWRRLATSANTSAPASCSGATL